MTGTIHNKSILAKRKEDSGTILKYGAERMTGTIVNQY
jgi:hypothetical protein